MNICAIDWIIRCKGFPLHAGKSNNQLKISTVHPVLIVIIFKVISSAVPGVKQHHHYENALRWFTFVLHWKSWHSPPNCSLLLSGLWGKSFAPPTGFCYKHQAQGTTKVRPSTKIIKVWVWAKTHTQTPHHYHATYHFWIYLFLLYNKGPEITNGLRRALDQVRWWASQPSTRHRS